MNNNALEIFDSGNARFWLRLQDAEQINAGRCISVEIVNSSLTPKNYKVPEETTTFISENDAEYLHAWLGVFLKNRKQHNSNQ